MIKHIAPSLRLLVIIIVAMTVISITAWSGLKAFKILGAVELGCTKIEALRILGDPNSPQMYDFVYEKKQGEVIVVFDDKTSKAECVIVRGDPKCSVEGIKVGDSRESVLKAYGQPERTTKYPKSGVECWYYPSKNVNFAIRGDKISSFSISSVQLKKQ